MGKIKKMEYSPHNRPISGLLSDIIDEIIDLEPKFQRRYVWNESMQKELIYSVMLKNPIGTITLWEKDRGDLKVTDGLQRLTTLKRFIENKFYIDGKIAKNIIEIHLDLINKTIENSSDKIDKNKAEKLKSMLIKKNPRIYYSDFIERMTQYFKDFEIPVMGIRYADETCIRDYFRRIQIQEKLKAGEIIHAIESLTLDQVMNQIDDINSLKKKLGFALDKRKEFEKVYYSLIGILEGKFTLGVLDRKIIKYVEELDERAEDFYSNKELQNKISKINNNFNEISKMDICLELGRSDLKFLIFQCANDFYGLKQNYGLYNILAAFGIVCNRFKAFYSYKPEEEVRKAYFPPEILNNSDLLKKYQVVSTLRKSSHKIESFEEKMKILKELIELEIKKRKPE